jgi:hypothetical protein
MSGATVGWIIVAMVAAVGVGWVSGYIPGETLGIPAADPPHSSAPAPEPTSTNSH